MERPPTEAEIQQAIIDDGRWLDVPSGTHFTVTGPGEEQRGYRLSIRELYTPPAAAQNPLQAPHLARFYQDCYSLRPDQLDPAQRPI